MYKIKSPQILSVIGFMAITFSSISNSDAKDLSFSDVSCVCSATSPTVLKLLKGETGPQCCLDLQVSQNTLNQNQDSRNAVCERHCIGIPSNKAVKARFSTISSCEAHHADLPLCARE